MGKILKTDLILQVKTPRYNGEFIVRMGKIVATTPSLWWLIEQEKSPGEALNYFCKKGFKIT